MRMQSLWRSLIPLLDQVNCDIEDELRISFPTPPTRWKKETMTFFIKLFGLGSIGIALLFIACTSDSTKIAFSAEKNPGPCPTARILYDTSRIVEMHGAESLRNVGFTGEIQKVDSICRYIEDTPIYAELDIDFALGKGPMAQGNGRSYRYYIAIARVDRALISKEYFDLPVKFERGRDRVFLKQHIDEIIIPRAGSNVSGANFEILVGFELTPEQIAFNRDGKRFRVNAGS